MYYVLVCFLLLLYILKLYIEKKYSYWKRFDVPFPKPSFIFGNVGKAFLLRESMPKILLNLYRNYEGYSYIGFYNFLSPAILVRDPELVNNFLIKNFYNFQDTSIRTGDPIAGVNPFFSGGQEWKKLRSQLAPQLSFTKLKFVYMHIEKVCQEMISYIYEQKESIDLNMLTYMFTGDCVTSCAYGLENHTFLGNPSVMVNVLKDFSRMSNLARISHTLGYFFPKLSKTFNISYFGRQTPKLLIDTVKFGMSIRMENDTIYNDFLDFLIQLKKDNDKSFMGHATSFYIDGFGTSGVLLAYCLLELAVNVDVQKTAADEVARVFNSHGSVCSSDAVKDLVYIENVVLETLRKHTVITYLNRECTKDCVIPHPKNPEKSVVIKKGTQIFLPCEGIHKDPKFYSDPKVFNPSRFNDKLKLKKIFLGFGDGPRICPGQHFALIQLKMCVASILSHFVIMPNNKTKFPLGTKITHLSKVPHNKIWVDFLPRK